MISTSPLCPTIKIVAQEPFAKVAERMTYWIRIVADKKSAQPSYAIAAMRCENREELHWLSASRSTPSEVARLMRSGFEIPTHAVQIVRQVLEELLKNGSAIPVDVACARAA